MLYFAAQLALPRKNIKLILKYLLGPLVFCILAISIYHQVQRQAGWEDSFQQIYQTITREWINEIAMVFILMFFNWGIEARKWQLALKHIEAISFGRSFKAVFTGTTMACFTPNRVGEYLGRILFIPDGKRGEAVSLTLVCSIAQLLVTLVAGIVGLIFLGDHIRRLPGSQESLLFWLQLVLYVAIIGALFLTLLYFRLAWLVRAIEKITILGKYMRYVRVLEVFNATLLARILSLSLTRYIVFLLQYYLLFKVFNVGVNWWDTLRVISVMFLVLAIAPTVAFLTDLGIRARASIELVQFFSSNVVGILATSLSVWLINLVIPALIGSLLILGIRINNYQSRQRKTER